MLKRLVNIVFVLLISNMVFAQIDSLKLNKTYFKKYWDDTKLIVTSPFRWEGEDWKKFGFVAGATTALIIVDQPIHDGFSSLGSEKLDWFSSNLLEPFGAEYSLAIAGSFALYGAVANDSKSFSTGLLAVESFVLSSLLVRVPKNIFGRRRPDSGQDISPWDFEGPFQAHGFPSGHTTAVFSVATVIATQYADTKWVPVLSYSVASLAGLSRVYDNRHWFSDVFAGAALGFAVGKLVTNSTFNHKISLYPYSTKQVRGLKLALTL